LLTTDDVNGYDEVLPLKNIAAKDQQKGSQCCCASDRHFYTYCCVSYIY
jgi:hypothetical protein